MKLIFFRFNRRGLPLPHTCVYESGILLRQRFTDSLAPYTIRQSRHPPQKDVQQPRDFICFTSHWMNLIYTDIRSLRSSDERYAVSWLTDLTNERTDRQDYLQRLLDANIKFFCDEKEYYAQLECTTLSQCCG